MDTRAASHLAAYGTCAIVEEHQLILELKRRFNIRLITYGILL